MDQFNEIIIATAGLLAILSNIYYQYKNRQINDNQEIIETLMAQRDAQDKISDALEKENSKLSQENHNYKNQYHDVLVKAKELEAELKTYKIMCNHEHDSKLD